jgi:hypothetical protein
MGLIRVTEATMTVRALTMVRLSPVSGRQVPLGPYRGDR